MKLPPYKEGCDAEQAKVACDYPETELKKIVAKKFVDSDSPAVDLVKKFKLDQRGPEPRREVHHRRQHVAGGRRREVDRGQPRQGRGLAGLTLTDNARARDVDGVPGTRVPHRARILTVPARRVMLDLRVS